MKPFLLLLVFLFTASRLSAELEATQPRMETALHFLQEARKSEHPLALLESARNELAKAKHNKAGYRGKAAHEVDRAINEVRSGDKNKVVGEIDNAIAAVHTAMSQSR